MTVLFSSRSGAWNSASTIKVMPWSLRAGTEDVPLQRMGDEGVMADA